MKQEHLRINIFFWTHQESGDLLRATPLSKNKAFLSPLWLSAHLQSYNSAPHLASPQMGFSSDQTALRGLMWVCMCGCLSRHSKKLGCDLCAARGSQHTSDKAKTSCCHKSRPLWCTLRNRGSPTHYICYTDWDSPKHWRPNHLQFRKNHISLLHSRCRRAGVTQAVRKD